MWLIFVATMILIGFYYRPASGTSETTLRNIGTQWNANKQVGDLTNREIFNLILRQRYQVKTGGNFPHHHETIINEISDDIEKGIAFYNDYSLTLTLYVIYLIENEKAFINSEKYGSIEEIFVAISDIIKTHPTLEKYAGYIS